MKKFFPLTLLVFLLGATAIWYFGHHRPTQKMLNAEPQKIYKATTPIRPSSPPDTQEHTGVTTHEHGNETETEPPMEEKNGGIVTTAETTDTSASVSDDPSEHMGTEDIQAPSEQVVSEHEHSHEHTQSEESKQLLEEVRVAREEGAKLEKEAHHVLANLLKDMSVEQQSAVLEQMKREFVNAKNPQTGGPTFDNREQALSLWQDLLEGLHAAGYTPPAWVE